MIPHPVPSGLSCFEEGLDLRLIKEILRPTGSVESSHYQAWYGRASMRIPLAFWGREKATLHIIEITWRVPSLQSSNQEPVVLTTLSSLGYSSR